MKNILLALSLIFSSFSLQAQDAKALFGRIPESLIPLLSAVNRADFIDFLDSKMKAEVKNKFDGTSEMTDLTADYIRIRSTERSTWEMKLLPLNDSVKVICTVSTACAPICDSEVRFYTCDWKEIPASTYLTLPAMDDYFQLTDSARLDDYIRYRKRMDMQLQRAMLSKEDHTLTFTSTTAQYMGDEEAGEEKPIDNSQAFLREPLVYVWEYLPATASYAFKR